MATYTKNAKIFEFVIFPIMVNMMNFQVFFVFFSAKIAFSQIMTKSYFAIFCFMFISSSFLTITTVKRAIFFIKVFCLRFWKGKIFTTNFTSTSHGKHSTNSFVRTFRRTSRGLIFLNDLWSSEKLLSTFRTNYRNFNGSKFVLTFFGAKKIFILFDLPKLCFNLNAALAAINFHIQPHIICEAL